MKTIYEHIKRHFIQYTLFLISCLISLIIYINSLEFKSPIFLIQTPHTLLIDNNQINKSPLKIVERENDTEILKNIYTTTLYFWNDGNLPIYHSDILEPLKIGMINKESEILDLKVIKKSRELIDLELNIQDKKDIFIDFKLLEKNDGFSLQIIYSGNMESQFTISGVVVGVKDNVFTGNLKSKLLYNYMVGSLYVLIIILSISLITVIFIFLGEKFLSDKIKGTFMIVLSVTVMLFVIYSFYHRVHKDLNQLESNHYKANRSLIPTTILKDE